MKSKSQSESESESESPTKSSLYNQVTTRLSRPRYCFLTGRYIGIPLGVILVLKIVFLVMTLCYFEGVGESFQQLVKRNDSVKDQDDCYSETKKQLVTLLLAIFVGEFGVDQFYFGNIGLGIGKLLTCGGCGVWWLVDIILWAINEHYRDDNGCLAQPI